MDILHLDYQRSMKPFSWGAIALLAVALASLIMTGIHHRELINQAVLWEANAGRIERAPQRQLPKGLSNERAAIDLTLELQHANEVMRQLALPWEKLFQAVESVSGKDVALLALEPDKEKRLVKISGEAKNMAALLSYIEQLEQCDVFGTIYLQSHQVQQQDPDKPVRFALLADWLEKS
jgi:hypothetical protein